MWRTVALVLGVAVARLVYLWWLCPYTLVEDEAHYWEWSTRLDWSYYSKGPGMALVIRAATELFGTTEAAVRLPAVVASAVAGLGVAGLAADVSRGPGKVRGPMNWRVGFAAAALFLLVPLTQILAIVSTIDGPMLACWSLACWGGWMALERGSFWGWVRLGGALGIGFAFKYTVLLLIPGIVLYALLRRGRLTLASGWQPLATIAAALTLAGLTPVVIWNAQNEWATVRHLMGHLGMAGGDMPVALLGRESRDRGYNPKWTAEFVGTQLGIVGPALALAVIGAAQGRRWWRRRCVRAVGVLYLLLCSAPVLLFYLGVTLVSEVEGNWAAGGYPPLVALGGWMVALSLARYRGLVAVWRRQPPDERGLRPWWGYVRRKPELPGQIWWHVALGYGLISGVGMLRLDWLSGVPALGEIAPVGRFVGARELGRHAGEVGEKLRAETGREVFFVAQHYGRASVLRFYLPGRPVVYCTSARMAGRRTQYDLWPDTSLDSPGLIGRPAVMLGATPEQWREIFREVRPIGRLRGDSKLQRQAFEGLGYTGYGDRAAGGGGGAGENRGGAERGRERGS